MAKRAVSIENVGQEPVYTPPPSPSRTFYGIAHKPSGMVISRHECPTFWPTEARARAAITEHIDGPDNDGSSLHDWQVVTFDIAESGRKDLL